MSKWPMVALGEIADVKSGGTPASQRPEYWDGDVLWATPKDLRALPSPYISNTERSLSLDGLVHSSAELLPPQSVLLSSRAPIGYVAINTNPMATNQGFKSLIPRAERLDPKYLFYWLRSNREVLENLGNGATFKELSKRSVESLQVPLPPVHDQRRIAAILEQADGLRLRRRASIAHLSDLARSTFTEMFGDPSHNAKGWPVVQLGSMLASANYGTSEKATASGTFAVLRMNNITYEGALDLESLKYMELPSTKVERFTVRDGDVLFNRTNSADLVGKTAVFRGDTAMAYAGYLIRLRTDSDNSPDYISHFLNSRYGKAVLRNMSKSIIGMANINAREVQAIKIPHPPKQLQMKFADMVRRVNLEKPRHQSSLTRLDTLFASLQSRAFAGEL